MRYVAHLLSAIVLLFIGGQEGASSLPIINIGDPFTGSLNINPATPLSPFSIGDFYGYENAGTIALSVDGYIFSSTISIAVFPQSWSSYSVGEISLNGITIPQSASFSQINVILPGNTGSTSILPLSLSSYDPPDPTIFPRGPNIQTHLRFFSENFVVNFGGPLSFFAPTGPSGDFVFGGILAESQTVDLAAPVPEPSTWAMLLIGFAGIGFASYRKVRRQITATTQQKWQCGFQSY
jgi:hypothetical protein